MYHHFIPLHSCDCLNEISAKINLMTDEGIAQNEMWHWPNNEIRAAVQIWFWERVELMAS